MMYLVEVNQSLGVKGGATRSGIIFGDSCDLRFSFRRYLTAPNQSPTKIWVCSTDGGAETPGGARYFVWTSVGTRVWYKSRRLPKDYTNENYCLHVNSHHWQRTRSNDTKGSFGAYVAAASHTPLSFERRAF
jgi:hypothetical protein